MTNYKWSHYNYYYFDDKSNTFIIYNTKSGAIGCGNTSILQENHIHEDATKLIDNEYFNFLTE